ncbi:MAG: GNAT family N-acetyltransferase [Thermomicrobiales bacterium]
MISQRFRVERLNDTHDRSAFSCGNPALDRYFREHAGQDLRRHLSAIFVAFDVASDAVVGYYALSACQIAPHALPPELAKRLPRRPVPATLIGRLAVDLRYRGQGLGGALLTNALARAVDASREIGSMAVIVDAKDDRAREFYERYGFRRLADDPYRLFLPMDEAERIARVVKPR